MPKILIVEKGGDIKELNLKSYSEDELFKKAGFKTSDGFTFQTKWNVTNGNEKKTICLYAKTKGRAGQENKYDFPPPVDNVLYYGSCVLVNITEGSKEEEPENEGLTVEEWNKIYEQLFGGFETLGSEDSELSTDGEEYANVPRTKEGYVIDDFVVESSEKELKTKRITKVKISKKKKEPEPETDTDEDEEELGIEGNRELDCSKELEEEEYV
jgi:hypothetical protein